jgi:hypothetical protein
MLTDEQIKKFQALHKERFGSEISREDAYEQGVKLVRLMAVVHKPMTKEEYEAIQKRRKSGTADPPKTT